MSSGEDIVRNTERRKETSLHYPETSVIPMSILDTANSPTLLLWGSNSLSRVETRTCKNRLMFYLSCDIFNLSSYLEKIFVQNIEGLRYM